MNPLQLTIAWIGVGLLGVAAFGCIARKRFKLWWFFTFYLATVFVTELLVVLAPARFHSATYWHVKEIFISCLRFGMAIEVARRTMERFPGAFATALRVVFVVLIATLVAILRVSVDPGRQYSDFVGKLQPMVLSGSAWMLIVIAGTILWYRLPVHPFRKAVLLSYIPYLLIFTIVLNYLGERGWAGAKGIQYLNQFAYVTLLAFWNYAIWRRDPAASDQAPSPLEKAPA